MGSREKPLDRLKRTPVQLSQAFLNIILSDENTGLPPGTTADDLAMRYLNYGCYCGSQSLHELLGMIPENPPEPVDDVDT